MCDDEHDKHLRFKIMNLTCDNTLVALMAAYNISLLYNYIVCYICVTCIMQQIVFKLISIKLRL